jgi:hypothetical protein
MVLEPFYWVLDAFQVLNPIRNRKDSMDAETVPTYTQNNTNRIDAQRHSCPEWDSKPRPQFSNGQRQVLP